MRTPLINTPGHRTRRRLAPVLAALAFFACRATPAGAQAAVAFAAGEPDAHATRDRYLLMAAGAVGSATFTQATAMPVEWKRTWHGFGARLGDQVGVGISQESLRLALLQLAPWKGKATTCEGAKAGHAFVKRIGRAAGCAIVNTLVVRNDDGARRPNVPFLGAVVGSSALSLAWRPERRSAAKGQSFVLTRISIMTGGAMGKSVLGYLK